MYISEYLLLILFSVAIRFDIDFRSFIREVGFELSDSKLGRGYQDAIAPPKLTWLSIVFYFVFSKFFKVESRGSSLCIQMSANTFKFCHKKQTQY
jgi:hypothetical protein